MIDSMSLSLAVLNGATSEERDGSALHVMDEEEFRAFYERTARPLWSYLSRITGNRQEADDVLQEAYYRFYRAGARHENEKHRRNSLFRIATNVVRDAQRRAKHHKDVPLEDEAVGQSSSPHAQVSSKTDLERAMQQLEPVQRSEEHTSELQS